MNIEDYLKEFDDFIPGLAYEIHEPVIRDFIKKALIEQEKEHKKKLNDAVDVVWETHKDKYNIKVNNVLKELEEEIEVLAELGLNDIREALISFNKPPQEAQEAEELEQKGIDKPTL